MGMIFSLVWRGPDLRAVLLLGKRLGVRIPYLEDGIDRLSADRSDNVYVMDCRQPDCRGTSSETDTPESR